MNGLDLLAIIIVILLVSAAARQWRIDRRDREREQSRAIVHSILRAIGQIR